jgi:hypothetical protein
MNQVTGTRPHWSFWLIGVIALVWNAAGVANYFVQMDPGMLEAYRASERALVENRPAWATAGFAVAVFGGTIGSLLLLLRQSASVYLFAASALGVVVTIFHALGSGVEFGAGELAGIIAMPLVVAGFLVWYCLFAGNRGWLR